VAEWKVLSDAISIRLINFFGRPQGATAFGVFGGHQVPFPSAGAYNFAAASDFESLGHSLPRFNSFRTSHNRKFLSKRAGNIGNTSPLCKRYFGEFLVGEADVGKFSQIWLITRMASR
jgi:hypothetical protein